MRILLVAIALIGIADTVTAQAAETGALTIEMTPVEIVGDLAADSISEYLPRDKPLAWQVYVPATYQVQSPPGVVVFVDPNGGGAIPDEWRSVFDANNMIWVGGITSATTRIREARPMVALLATRAVNRHYALDMSRLYISGYSDGAIEAAKIAMRRPDEFKGGIYMSGSYFWFSHIPPSLDMIRKNSFVFITGSEDPAEASMRSDFRKYRLDQIPNTRLIVVEGMGHEMPDADYLDVALKFVDEAQR